MSVEDAEKFYEKYTEDQNLRQRVDADMDDIVSLGNEGELNFTKEDLAKAIQDIWAKTGISLERKHTCFSEPPAL